MKKSQKFAAVSTMSLLVCVGPLGCATQTRSTAGDYDVTQLRRMIVQVRSDIDDLRRDQEQLRASVESLEQRRADPYVAVPTPHASAPSSPPAGGGAHWPPDPWSSAGSPSYSDPTVPSEEDIVAGVTSTGSGRALESISLDPSSPSIPGNLGETAFATATNAFLSSDYDTAIQEYRNFLHADPTSPYADDAQYWIAESYLRKGLYSNALKEFNQVVLRYGNGDRGAGALLKLAEVFSKTGDDVDARLSLQKLVNRYPGTPEAKEAYGLLQGMGG